ncbi:GNAT family N-acetyltransferase [Streptomyces sp. NPDC001678]|uniref:GNAT family N-acetyltransferase n=1 Tax=Streptomyces sp. NPDC001678 TaxID=3364599 RepID=UPI0036CCF73F
MANTRQTSPDTRVEDRSRQDRPDHPVAFDDAAIRQARNSAAFWAALGNSRGHEVIRRRGFLAVVGGDRAGTRVLLQEPDLDAHELAELTALAGRSVGPVDAEDPFSSTDLSHLGLRNWQMPVMVRPPGPAPAPATEVIRVQRTDELRTAEQIVIEGFELIRFTPYRPGELFPTTLIEQPGVDVFLVVLDGEAVGAGVTVVHDGVGGHYWVGTASAHRSRGAGRAVMLGSLVPMANLPVTLTASQLGRPLYESLGFTAVTSSTWWSSQ